MASSAPVTVTVWAVLQLPGVKVREPEETVPSVVSLEAMAMVTLAVGAESSTTSKLAVPPASVVVRPLVGLTLMPTVSVSVISVLAVGLVMAVVPLALVGLVSSSASASVPSTRASSAAVRAKLKLVPTKLLPSKVRVLPLRVSPVGRAASMAASRTWVVSVPVSAPPATSAISTLTLLPAFTAWLRVMVKVTDWAVSSLMVATSRLKSKVTC